jgi:Ca2+-binding RTX toxin-like protein
MSEWLLLFLLPLGAAAFADLFQHENEETDNSAPRPEPEPQTDGTAGDDTLSAPDGYHGRVMGRDGDDLITVGSPENASHYHDGTNLTPDDGQWNGWPDWDPNSPGAVPPGVVLARGGEGADTIIGSGRGIHAQGDAGDDRIELHSQPGDLGEGRGDFAVVGRGGDGDDEMIVSGSGALVLGDAGNDSIRASGDNMVINGGDGADHIDVAGLRNSEIVLGRGDVVTGRSETADGLRFRLHDGADFTGNSSDESFVAREGSRVDGGGGNDMLTNSYLDRSSVTLIGGAGDDSLVGNDAVGAHASTAQDGYRWRVGASSDSLDGGDGNDLIGYDTDDTITGGSGADRMDGFVDSREHATVTDFNPAEDWLRINIPPDEAGDDSDRFGNVSVAEEDGDTVIRLGSDEVMRIENATGLNIGFQTDRYREEWSDGSIHEGEFSEGDGEVLNDHTIFTDLDGNKVDRGSLDVVINSYLTLYT